MARKIKKSKVPKKMGRPLIPIDWDQFQKLCELQCSAEEIAFFFRCSKDTIEERCMKQFGMTFAATRTEKGVMGKVGIRRQLFASAMKGNLGALIWLSKQHLGMKEKVETTNFDGDVQFHIGFGDEDGPKPKEKPEPKDEKPTVAQELEGVLAS